MTQIQYKFCEMCGKSYAPGRADSMFCSDACKQKAYRRRVDPEVGSIHREKQRQTNIAITKQMTTKELDCAVCGRHLHVSISHTNLAYCSNACKQKAYRARKAADVAADAIAATKPTLAGLNEKLALVPALAGHYIEQIPGKGLFLCRMNGDQKETKAFLGTFAKAEKWMNQTVSSGIPNYAALRSH